MKGEGVGSAGDAFYRREENKDIYLYMIMLQVGKVEKRFLTNYADS